MISGLQFWLLLFSINVFLCTYWNKDATSCLPEDTPIRKTGTSEGEKYNFISKLLLINFLLIDTTSFLCLRLYGADGCALMKRIKASKGFGHHPEKYSERRGTAARWRDGKRKGDDGRVGAIGKEDRMEILATMECPFLCASVCVRNVYNAVIFLFCKGLFSEEYLSVHK